MILTKAYKIYAKVLARRLNSHLKSWIRKEKKGSNKEKYVLYAINALWEGVEYVEETKQDFYFLKIEFDKAFNRLEWGFTISSLKSMGFNPTFIS